jgi:hypothetical protein
MPKLTKNKPTSNAVSNVGRIDRTNPEHIAYLNEQKHIFSDASDYFVAETNETERALCAQLMLIDTVLLTGALVAVANKDLFDILTIPTRTLTIFALTFLLISMGCGIKYYFAIIRYNKNWALAKHSAMKAFLDSKIQTWSKLRETTDNFQITIHQELENPWLRLQILFITSAAAFYLVALFGLLFNVSDILGHL